MLKETLATVVHTARRALPEGVVATLPTDQIAPADRVLARQLLKSTQTRVGSATLLTAASGITPQEELGIVYFMSLINAADNFTDSRLHAGHTLSEHLLSHQVRDTRVSIGELKERTLDCFSEEKQGVIVQFLGDMADLHENQQPHDTGTYGYSDALSYRLITTGRYASTAARLVDADVRQTNDIVEGAMAFQYIDDAADIRDDIADGQKNLFVGMAADNNELPMLHKAGTKNRQVFRAPPVTHTEYMQKFQHQVDQLSHPVQKGILRAARVIYMAMQ